MPYWCCEIKFKTLNAKDYIESGILELYAAGGLSEQERKEVESMVEQYPEVRAELMEIEKAFEDYARAHAKEAPAHLLDSILQSVDAAPEVQREAKTIKMNTGPAARQNWLRYLAYAASILLFLSIGLNIYYFNSYHNASRQLSELENQNSYFANQYDVIRADYNKMESQMSVFRNPAYVAITMKGQAISPAATSMVYWDKSAGSVYVLATNLPAPAAGKQYQLWALKDGKPIDAGVFDMKGDLQQMKAITDADAFAVTLEPAGGSVSPTLDQLYMVGGV